MSTTTAETGRAPADPDGAALAFETLLPGRTWSGLTSREATVALQAVGPNDLPDAERSSWVSVLVAQLVHPLAILLWAAAALAALTHETTLAVAIVVVLGINAAFAFVQESQAEHAVDAIKDALPPQARVCRDGRFTAVPASDLVPGDVIIVGEGDQAPADARIVDGGASVDASMLTGESATVERVPVADPVVGPLLQAPQLILRGTSVVAGDVKAVVFATGERTQIGEVARLTSGIRPEPSPLERQVRRVAWVISVIAVAIGMVFLPVGILAGLSWKAATVFAIGLLIANVPEGLLPTITLALAGGVRRLARHGAVLKRLSAVETLGSTSTICTDKTGTLTQNRMTVRRLWTPPGTDTAAAARVMGWCHSVHQEDEALLGDPTEIALVEHAQVLTGPFDLVERDAQIVTRHRFDAGLRRMSVVARTDGVLEVLTKGALEAVLPRCADLPDGSPLQQGDRDAITAAAEALAASGCRVLALATKPTDMAGAERSVDETDLRFAGLVGLMDPPRVDAKDAVARCHTAGIRVHMITGDHPSTAAAVAREVGIATTRVVDGDALSAMTDEELRATVQEGEVVFARSSPQDKLRIARAVRATGSVFAMTGDGVNDAPALRYADIGIAMGRGGTDVAREAASMVLADDDFATIVTAIESGRQVYANIRKFIVYVFAHAIPEVVPFIVFALSGGAVPLGITGMQILAVDLGTETLPALALGQERAEPGAMERPPRAPSEHIITKGLLIRSWLLLGGVSAVLTGGAYLLHLHLGGWSPGMDTGPGSPLHQTYREATTITFLGIVLCQVGTAFAARTSWASLRDIGVLSNRPLLWGIAFELVVTAGVVYLPAAQEAFGTAALSLTDILPLLTFPVIVWGVDELWRAARRRRVRRFWP
ncbi:cation-translocating P-type ATPase [Aeromicrobium terrae]|uniref:Cation-transporting P-type ATPase n=1 Tax=Aeromicrobium terrae TaxID=2498846 RepID=A0A5C8NF17_9ACTN|nr:cation-transporting P-type ATPase [Aeromicrobium terrae]TXL57503.1 cation-transporting P-type ATPase [Aeromicrobium terrae]